MKSLWVSLAALFLFLLPASMVVDQKPENRQRIGTSGILALSFAQEKPPAPKRITKETTVVSKIGTFKAGTLTVSPDGRHFAYARKEGKRWVVELDGKAEGTYKDVAFVNGPVQIIANSGLLSFVGFKPMIFSADSRHIAYSVLEEDNWHMVQDGKKGKPYESIGSPVMNRDGMRLAYPARVKGGWCMVVDGTEGKAYEKVGPPAFSADGNHIAYAARSDRKERMVIDGVEGKAYESLDIVSIMSRVAFPDLIAEIPVFSPDGRLAHRARQSGKWYLVVDGQESEASLEMGDFVFSPDGKHFAFSAQKPPWTIIVDGQAQGSFEKKPTLFFFSPGSQRLVVNAEKDGKYSIMIDGKTVEADDDVAGPAFSPDGSRFAYMAKTGKQWAAVIDGVKQKAYKAIELPVFSPDGSHVAYRAAKEEKNWLVVVDGVEGKIYEGMLKGFNPVFDDNSHLRYFIVSQEQIIMVEEELQAGP